MRDLRWAFWVFVVLAFVACGGDDPPPDIDAPPDIPDLPELDLTLREQVAAMERGDLASATLTAGYLDRIAIRDEGPSGINAVLALDPTAASQAATVDEERGASALLQGAVIIIKDNVDTAGLATTGGSIALDANIPAADAPVVAKLREANAVILGKANLSEWANFRAFGSTSGWSSAGGQTRNGFLAGYNPCGSSSGSGAAVASGTVSAALGTETNGSIVCPASINGIVGFKPTVGLVSRRGVIPIASSYDTVGPMTKDVGDAARLMAVLAGFDPADPATDAIPPDFDFDFEAALATATLSGKRIGVVRSLGFDGATTQLFNMELERLAAAGAILVDVNLNNPALFGQDSFTVMKFEFKELVATYLAAHPAPGQPLTLAELIAFNSANAGAVMPFFGQQIFMEAQQTTGTTSQTYLDAKARARTAALDDGILATMAAGNVEVLISPTTGPAWMTNYATGDAFTGGSSSHAAIAGCPHLTVPMGDVGGLPVGMSFYARPFEDAKVLAFGHAYEQVRTEKRSVPFVAPVAGAIPNRAGM